MTASEQHVTKASVTDLGVEIGRPRFVGRCVCACGWTWESHPRVDWMRARAVAELVGVAHRIFESIE